MTQPRPENSVRFRDVLIGTLKNDAEVRDLIASILTGPMRTAQRAGATQKTSAWAQPSEDANADASEEKLT